MLQCRDACLKALCRGDTVVIWKLDRLGRDLRHLGSRVGGLTKRGIGLKALAGEGASIDTTTANGRPIFAIVARLAEFGRELIVERTCAGRPIPVAGPRSLAPNSDGLKADFVEQICYDPDGVWTVAGDEQDTFGRRLAKGIAA